MGIEKGIDACIGQVIEVSVDTQTRETELRGSMTAQATGLDAIPC